MKEEEKKYGANRKDGYRDVETGELSRGLLQDSAMDKLKKLRHDKGKGAAQSGADRGPLPKGPYYDFLTGCN